jgi:hypothetical protein
VLKIDRLPRNGIPFSSECGLMNRRTVGVIRGCSN